MDKGGVANDRLRLAAFFLKALLIFCVVAPLLLFFDASIRRPVEESRSAALFRSLDLTNLALIPSGREIRNPEWADPRLDWRVSPFFPLPDPDPASMIFRGAVRAHGVSME